MNSPNHYQQRISAFREALAEKNIAAALVSSPLHVRYLSGIVSAWSPAFLLIAADSVTAIVPASAGIAAPSGLTLAPYADGSIHEPAVPRHAALTELGRILAARHIPLDRLGVERRPGHRAIDRRSTWIASRQPISSWLRSRA